MEAITFDEARYKLGAHQPEYGILPCHISENSDEIVTACFKLSPEEVKTVTETGVIWVQQITLGDLFQPIKLSVEKPELK